MSTQPAPIASNQLPKLKMTMKKRLLLENIANGETIAEAGRKAGFASRHNAHDAYRDMREKIPELMEELGIGPRVVLARLRDKLEATRTVTASHAGHITDSMEVADNPTQMAAIELAADLNGLTHKDAGPSIGTLNIVWGGQAPSWATAKPLPQSNANDMVIDSVLNGNSNNKDNATLPLSAIEGTGIGRGVSPPTHSGKNLSDRMAKRKRKPRLPVFKGESK